MESKREVGLLRALPLSPWRQFAWRCVAGTALALGAVGILLPVMPTVPFMILAAWAAQRGWPQLEHWLLRHATFGPHIHAWRDRGSIPRRAKWLATGMMACSGVLVVILPIPLPVVGGIWLCFVAVCAWLWTRPD